MFREGIPSKQLSAWIAAALIPVLSQMLGGAAWLWLLGAGAVSVVAVWLVWRFGAREYPRWLCGAQLIFVILLLGSLLEKAAESWPTGHPIAVPLIMLAAAAWSAQKGVSAAARVGTVLFWFIIVMYLVVFGAGAREIEVRWLAPRWENCDLLGIALLILPAGAAGLLQRGGKWGVWLSLPVVIAVLSSLIAAGVMSPDVAKQVENPIYELSGSLSLFGVAKRFEAVISAGMTAGWFLLMSLLLSMSGNYFEGICEKKGRVGVWIATALSAAWLLCGLHIPQWILLVGAAVFWVAAPILTQGMVSQKKS